MIRLAFVFLVCSLATSPLSGARAPDDASKADYVVTGKVEKVFQRTEGRLTEYNIRIRLNKIEKGSGYKPGELMHVYCYQRKRSLIPVADDLGHDAVPEERQQITATIHHRKTGVLEGNFPDWFVARVESKVLKKEVAKLVETFLEKSKNTGDAPPKGLDADAIERMMLADIRKSDPGFLMVAPETEKRWQAGKFNDKQASARVRKSIKFLETFNIELPRMHRELIEEFQTDGMKAARLEVTAQLLDSLVVKTTNRLMN